MDKIDFACKQVLQEFGLGNVKLSLVAGFDTLQKSHDSTHEFLFLGPLFFPLSEPDESNWQKKSAFLIYQYEAFHLAHRSLMEALCGYYNAAFILLRTTVEMVLKGAFWQCLSQTCFRDNAPVLRKEKSGKEILKWLTAIFKQAPSVAGEMEALSAAIFDKIGARLEDPQFRPSIKTVVKQLDEWNILKPSQKRKPMFTIQSMRSYLLTST